MPNRPAATLAVCLAAAFTTLLDQSSLNTAIPALRTALDAGPATLQWIISGYSLTFGLALVPGGRLGDAYGRKALFVGGLALFTVAGMVAGTSSEAWVVAVARLVQGAGAGLVNPQIFGLIQDLFTGSARTRALGAYATVGGIAAIIGPLAGGAVIGAAGESDGWRWVLLLNSPFGLLVVPLAIWLLPRSGPAPDRRPNLDLPGLALLGVLTLSLLLPFIAPSRWWLVSAPVALGALLIWEREYANRGRTPILAPGLVRSRGFVLGTVVAMFQFGSALSASLALTLYLQDGLGWSPLAAALTMLPSAIGFAVAASVSWRVVSRFGRASVTAALAVCGLAVLATIAVLTWVPPDHLVFGLAVTQFVVGVTGGLIVSPNQALTLAHAPAGAAGLASGFLAVSQRISATIAMAAVGGVVLGVSGPSPAGVVHGLLICAGMLLLGTAFAALDHVRRPQLPGSRPAGSRPAGSPPPRSRLGPSSRRWPWSRPREPWPRPPRRATTPTVPTAPTRDLGVVVADSGRKSPLSPTTTPRSR